MAGPNSAPNGDASLVSGQRICCPKHGFETNKCAYKDGIRKCPDLVSKRMYLAQTGKLRTGKTKR